MEIRYDMITKTIKTQAAAVTLYFEDVNNSFLRHESARFNRKVIYFPDYFRLR